MCTERRCKPVWVTVSPPLSFAHLEAEHPFLGLGLVGPCLPCPQPWIGPYMRSAGPRTAGVP